MLGGLYAVHVSQLHSLVDCLSLGGRRRGSTPRASVSSSITHRVLSLCLHLSSLKYFPVNFCCGCDFNWFKFLSILYLAYIHILHINCLTLSLHWYFVNWGSNRSRVFCTHIELSIIYIDYLFFFEESLYFCI